MLTLFTTAKPMKGHFGLIQANALESWTKLEPRPEVIVLGDEEGVGDLCRRLGFRHIPNVQRTEKGTPLLSDLFKQGQDLARNDLICYCNADILLFQDFMDAARLVSEVRHPFLLTGCRWDLWVREPIRFSDAGWQERLRQRALSEGVFALRGVDYFMFRRGFYDDVPAFAIGRYYFDTWLLGHPKRRKAWLINATQSVLALHQMHDYSHAISAGGELSATSEAKANLAIYTTPDFNADLGLISTHLIEGGRIKSNMARAALYRFKSFVKYDLGKVRHALGLRREPRAKRTG